MIETLFWILIVGILYVYFGFPFLLFIRSARRRKIQTGEVTPPVSMVIVAHNEAGIIGAKLANALALDYPHDKLEIIVASDGSDDGTDAIVSNYADSGVRLILCPRGGKIPALNRAVSQARGEVLVFSDANSMYDRDALRMLVRPFADVRVGGVAGNQCYLNDASGSAASAGERAYWAFDRMLKTWQSRAGNVIAATGAIYAMRRELFVPVPLGVCDDFTISTGVIRRGRWLVFEPAAVAREPVASTDGAEFRRKSRIAARGLRTMLYSRDLFNPLRHGFYSIQIASHKLLRWCICWMLLVLLVVTVALYEEGSVYRLALAGQMVLYGLALVGMALRGTRLTQHAFYKIFSVPFYFCLANTAALAAWFQVMQGRRVDVWNSPRQHARVGIEGEARA